MKKLSVALLAALALSACTADYYADKGNAEVVTSKYLSDDVVELVVKKDDGKVLTLTRKYDSHVTVGSRVNVSDDYQHQDSDLKSIKRYEFK